MTKLTLDAAHDLISQADETLKPHDLTYAQFSCLHALADRPVNLAALATALHISPSSATRMVDRLSARRLVSRKRAPVDHRNVVLTLTPTGSTVYGQAREALGS